MASEAENTFANSKKTPPSNNQDSPSSDSEDREDTVVDNDETTDASSNRNNNFTFMGNEGSAALQEISKYTSVEQYRDFLEKELGEEKLMRAYPLLKEFVSYYNQLTIYFRETRFCSLKRLLNWRVSYLAS